MKEMLGALSLVAIQRQLILFNTTVWNIQNTKMIQKTLHEICPELNLSFQISWQSKETNG